jgi:hypothetical protein
MNRAFGQRLAASWLSTGVILIFSLREISGGKMNLSAPKQTTFIVAVVLAVLGLLAAIIPLGFVSTISFWLVLIGFIVLAVGCLAPNL